MKQSDSMTPFRGQDLSGSNSEKSVKDSGGNEQQVVWPFKPTPLPSDRLFEMTVGDIKSTEKGSGARANGGKTPLRLIPISLIAESYLKDLGGEKEKARKALELLGEWQAGGDSFHLHKMLRVLGLSQGWDECAAVFEYGIKKYSEWNWAKGMAWGVPMECAARHLRSMIEGETHDLGPLGSQLPHRGHVFCNVVMLLHFVKAYPQGDDRPEILFWDKP